MRIRNDLSWQSPLAGSLQGVDYHRIPAMPIAEVLRLARWVNERRTLEIKHLHRLHGGR